MEKVEIEIFKFDELDDDSKEVARSDFRQNWDYPFFDEDLGSVRAFCQHFNADLKDYQVGGSRGDYIRSDATTNNFRGLKLKDIDRDAMPTGYCMDCDLWFNFYDEFKASGDAYHAFMDTLDHAVKVIARNVDDFFSDESADDTIICNEYDFTADGKVFYHKTGRAS